MKRAALLAGVAIASFCAVGASAQTLEAVKARGVLKCGINTGLAGFAYTDSANQWQGFDVAFCRALAGAVLGDPTKVEFIPTTTVTRFELLAAPAELDVLSRNTTWTLTRDADLKFTFLGISYYDGQGFMVPADSGVTSATELSDATICVQSGTTTELNLADYFKSNGLNLVTKPVETSDQGQTEYLAETCDAYTTDISGLAAMRATFENPEAHVILPEVISKEPLGPLVREGDDRWADIGRWVFNALVTAEELGITKSNAAELAAAGTENPDANRLLGREGELGKMLGLPNDWAVKAIQAEGNYGEIFEAYLTPIGLERGLNAQWSDGGLLYAPPFR